MREAYLRNKTDRTVNELNIGCETESGIVMTSMFLA